MTEYRVCFNSRPHCKDYWTVERSEEPGLFRPRRWKTVQRHLGGLCVVPMTFKTEDEARAWVAEDKKPSVHACKPA